MSARSVLQCPSLPCNPLHLSPSSGLLCEPRRTRHLRLRSHVLRERLQLKLWHPEHVPGADLCSDLLTKAITLPRSWSAFGEAVGLKSAAMSSSVDGERSSKAMKIACGAAAALGMITALRGLSGVTRVASMLGVAALAALVGSASTKTAVRQSKKRSNPAPSRHEKRWSRENEPDPCRKVHEGGTENRQVGSFADRRFDLCHPGRPRRAINQGCTAYLCTEVLGCPPWPGD